MSRTGSYVEGAITLKSWGEGDIQSNIEAALVELGYTWLSGWGVVEDAFASEWVKCLNQKTNYPRFHLKVRGVQREGERLLVAVQVHLDIAKHDSPMDEASIRRCQREIERLGGWTDSLPC